MKLKTFNFVIVIALIGLCYSCVTAQSSPSASLCMQGFQAYKNRDWNNAIHFYNKAYEAESSSNNSKNSPNLCVYLFRPLAYARVGKFEEAIADANLLINMRPEAMSYIRRCEVLSRYGSHKEALDDCETAVKKEPNIRSLMSSKATTLIRSGKIDDGLKLLNEALNLNKEDPLQTSLMGSKVWILFAKAEALDEAGMYKEAIVAYKEALSSDEDAAETERKEKVKETVMHGVIGYLTVTKKDKLPEGMTKFAKERILELERFK